MVNVGLLHDVAWRGTTVHAAIFEGHGLLKANWQFLNTCATKTV
jgi:hypothetical protein